MSLYEGPSIVFPNGRSRVRPHQSQSERYALHEQRTGTTAPPSLLQSSVPQRSARRDTSPSPEAAVMDSLTNSSLATAALHSSNPYLRAGVLAVAHRAASSSARRSVSTHSNHTSGAHAAQTGRRLPSSSASRSRSPSLRGVGSNDTFARPSASRKSTQERPTSHKQHHRNSAKPQLSMERHYMVDSGDVYAHGIEDDHVDASNVWVTDGTLIEDIASPPRQSSLRGHRNGISRATNDNDPNVAANRATHSHHSVGGYYYRQGGLDDRTFEHAPQLQPSVVPTSADVFVELMRQFSSRFGSIRPSTDNYVPEAMKKLTVPRAKATSGHHETVASKHFDDEEEDDDVSTPLQRLEFELGGGARRKHNRSAAKTPKLSSSVMSPVVVMSFAASPDRRRVDSTPSFLQSSSAASYGYVTAHPSSYSYDDTTVGDLDNGDAPALHVSEQLLQLTFTCGHCNAKHMRGLQCTRCHRPLPHLCRCVQCASWMRGAFCSTCGHRQPAPHDSPSQQY